MPGADRWTLRGATTLVTTRVEDTLRLLVDDGESAVTTSGANVGPCWVLLRRAGILVISVVTSVALQRRMARPRVDGLIPEGMESGGRIGDVATLPLVTQVVEAVDIPVLAAG